MFRFNLLLICAFVLLAQLASCEEAVAGVDGSSAVRRAFQPIQAIKSKNIDELRAYLAEGGNPNDFSGINPLIVATIHQFHDGMSALLDFGANVDVVEGDGWSPLMFAAANGHVASINMLLARNANPFLVAKKGPGTAYACAKSGKFQEVAKILLDQSLAYSINHNSHTEDMMTLIELGADWKYKSVNGHSAFILQCSSLNVPNVKTLVTKYNVNYNDHENDGWNCLTFAAFLGNVELVQYLLTLPHVDVAVALNRAEGRGHVQIANMIREYIERSVPEFSMSYSMQAPREAASHHSEPVPAEPVHVTPEPVVVPEPVVAAPVVVTEPAVVKDERDALKRKQDAIDAAVAAAEEAEKQAKETARQTNAADFASSKAQANSNQAKPTKTLFGWLFGNK